MIVVPVIMVIVDLAIAAPVSATAVPAASIATVASATILPGATIAAAA